MIMCEWSYSSGKRWLSANVFAVKHCLLLHRALGTSIVELITDITDITKAKAVVSVHIDQPMPYQQKWFAARQKAKYI
jgi:hypothetical protein